MLHHFDDVLSSLGMKIVCAFRRLEWWENEITFSTCFYNDINSYVEWKISISTEQTSYQRRKQTYIFSSESVCNQFSSAAHDVDFLLSNHVKLLCVHFEDGKFFKADEDRHEQRKNCYLMFRIKFSCHNSISLDGTLTGNESFSACTRFQTKLDFEESNRL